jgi:hypothetical protein
MKSVKAVSWVICAGFVLLACHKYESNITGKAVYVDKADNESYPAAHAVVSKCVADHDTLKTISSVKADQDGNYVFEFVTKGKYVLYAHYVQDDSLVYTGFSDEFAVNGEDDATKDVLLTEDRERQE